MCKSGQVTGTDTSTYRTCAIAYTRDSDRALRADSWIDCHDADLALTEYKVEPTEAEFSNNQSVSRLFS